MNARKQDSSLPTPDTKVPETKQRRGLGAWRWPVAVLLILFLLIGGSVFGWQRYGAQITQSTDYVLEAEDFQISPQPPWIRTDIVAEVLQSAGLAKRSVLDKQLTVQVAQAFAEHPWVRNVTRVSKHHPPQIEVELVYRKPVAMVEVILRDQPGLLPVDADGYLLPPSDFSAEQARDYLRVFAQDTLPAGSVGTSWGDPRVHGAARVALFLQEHWKQLGLYRVLADQPTASLHIGEDPTFQMETRQGARIVWGRAPRMDDAADDDIAINKVAELLAYAQQHGPLDGLQTGAQIDLRGAESRHPSTAGRPRNRR